MSLYFRSDHIRAAGGRDRVRGAAGHDGVHEDPASVVVAVRRVDAQPVAVAVGIHRPDRGRVRLIRDAGGIQLREQAAHTPLHRLGVRVVRAPGLEVAVHEERVQRRRCLRPVTGHPIPIGPRAGHGLLQVPEPLVDRHVDFDAERLVLDDDVVLLAAGLPGGRVPDGEAGGEDRPGRSRVGVGGFEPVLVAGRHHCGRRDRGAVTEIPAVLDVRSSLAARALQPDALAAPRVVGDERDVRHPWDRLDDGRCRHRCGRAEKRRSDSESEEEVPVVLPHYADLLLVNAGAS